MEPPAHIAIVMDGNGRWARERGYPRVEGHREGAESVREITESCVRKGVDELTLFTFSMDNWKRPDEEVSFLMDLLKMHLRTERDTIMENEIDFRMIGRREQVPEEPLQLIDQLDRDTRDHEQMVLRLALNYAGKQELVDAIRDVCRDVESGAMKPEEVDQEVVQEHLYDPSMSDPDLLVRTGGEQRMSNFLLWQLSYTEIYFTEDYWPEFRKDQLTDAIESFQRRERRFGGLKTT